MYGGDSWRPPGGETPRGIPGHVVALRPLTVGDTLDGVFRLLRASFGRLIAVVLLIVGPYQLLSSALMARVAPGLGEISDPTQGFQTLADDLLAASGWLVLVFLIGLVVSVVVAGALTAVAGATDRGEELTVGEALQISLRRSGAMLGATVLVLLTAAVVALMVGAVGAGLAFAIDPLAILILFPVFLLIGLAALILSYLVIPIAMEEEQGAWVTFRRSVSLLRRRFGYVVGITLLVLVLLLAVQLGLTLVFLAGSFALAGLAGLGWVAEAAQAILSSLISAPVTALAAWVIHRDARVRLEAYDLVVRNQALGGEPSA